MIRHVGNLLIPYDAKKLAEITKTELDTVIVALEVLKGIGLVEVLENGEIYLPYLADLIGSETSSTVRSRKCRENKKIQQNVTEMLQCNTVATPLQQNCNREIEKEKEKEIEKELEIEIELEGECEREKKTPSAQTNYAEIVGLYHEHCPSYPRIKNLSEKRKTAIKARLKKYSKEQLIEAFDKAEASDFLKGGNGRDWSADFDWILNDTNIAKILDGKYGNDRRPQQKGNQASNNKFNGGCASSGRQDYNYSDLERQLYGL